MPGRISDKDETCEVCGYVSHGSRGSCSLCGTDFKEEAPAVVGRDFSREEPPAAPHVADATTEQPVPVFNMPAHR